MSVCVKSIEEIKKEIALECGEESFDVLIEAEISVGGYETAIKLVTDLGNKYMDQYKKIIREAAEG